MMLLLRLLFRYLWMCFGWVRRWKRLGFSILALGINRILYWLWLGWELLSLWGRLSFQRQIPLVPCPGWSGPRSRRSFRGWQGRLLNRLLCSETTSRLSWLITKARFLQCTINSEMEVMDVVISQAQAQTSYNLSRTSTRNKKSNTDCFKAWQYQNWTNFNPQNKYNKDCNK